MKTDTFLWHGDCFDLMKNIPDHSVDLCLVDPPYKMTQNEWDERLPLEPMWRAIKRVCKKNAAVVFTASHPYAAELVVSQPKMFRYDLIWQKTNATGFLNANRMPLRAHDTILVFYQKLPTYNPQKTTGHQPVNSYTKKNDGTNYGKTKSGITGGGSTERFPISVLLFPSDKQKSNLHPTQKPVALMEYLIKTYSNPGDRVLDFCAGSATTLLAASNLGRGSIGIDADPDIYAKALDRLETSGIQVRKDYDVD